MCLTWFIIPGGQNEWGKNIYAKYLQAECKSVKSFSLHTSRITPSLQDINKKYHFDVIGAFSESNVGLLGSDILHLFADDISLKSNVITIKSLQTHEE